MPVNSVLGYYGDCTVKGTVLDIAIPQLYIAGVKHKGKLGFTVFQGHAIRRPYIP